MLFRAFACAGLFLGTSATAATSGTWTLQNRAAAADAFEGYAFLYFTGSDEQIYIAASNGNDALSFTELNGGRPILRSSLGDKGLRDPFVMRSHDGSKFYILATDLCIGCGTNWGNAQTRGSRHMEIWESPDLVTFSKQRHVLVSPDTYGNTWAPEAYWDAELRTYVVYWASGIYDDPQGNPGRAKITYQRMVYATTPDFVTFSAPRLWQDEPPHGRIDSTVTRADDGTYHRFTKATTADGCADIVHDSSKNLTAPLPAWTRVASCIGTRAGTKAVEGPSIFRTNPGDVRGGNRYVLIVDEFGGNGYVPLESNDLASGRWTLNRNFTYPKTPRHGTILPVTAKELERIKKAYGGA